MNAPGGMLNHVFNDISEQGEQAASKWLQGSVESTHKVPTSHYHTKHEHLAKRSAQKTERHTTAVLYTLTVGLTVHVMNRFKPGASCVIRVSMCVPYVSFVCPGSPRCLFTGTTSVAHYMYNQLSPALETRNTDWRAARSRRQLDNTPVGTLTTGPLIDSCAKRSALNDSGARTSERAPKRLPKRPRSRRSR